jgi:hypothetical protein
MRLLMLFTLSLVICCSFAMAQAEECGRAFVYENRNQVNPRSLILQSVRGRVFDSDRTNVPGICLGVFSNDGKTLIATAAADRNGHFAFETLNPGKYRLVARGLGFCTANVPISLVRRKTKTKPGNRRIALHMRPRGIDSCSYGGYK